MRRHTLTTLAFCIGLAALGGPALAQPGPGPASQPGFAPPPPGGQGGDRQAWRDERREEMRRKIETIRIARLTEELNLDPETAIRLVPLLSKFDELERTHREQRRTLYHDVRQLFDSGSPEDAALRDKMEAFWDLEERHLEARRELFDETDDILTVQQQAQLMLFIPRFRMEVRQLIHEARRDRRGPDGEAPAERPRRRTWDPGWDDDVPE